ncbi:MAG: suppressor of fused domain protein [Pseudomonadota bacterium]
MSFLEICWEQREESIYKSLLEDLGPGIYPLDANVFRDKFKREELDPRWFHYGVFKCPPVANRKHWVYISSGMSNPWETDSPEEYSGFGTEFLIETQEESAWAITALHSLVAFNILLSVGHYGDKPLVDYGDRMPLSVEPYITNVMVTQPRDFPSSFNLDSGRVDLLQITGITADELSYAKRTSSEELAQLIYRKMGTLAFNPKRESVGKV